MSGPQPSQTLRSGIGDGFGWRRGFSCSSVSKESACTAGDLGLIPGLGRSPGEGNGHPLQYPCLEKSHGERSLVGCGPWGRMGSQRVRHDWATNTSLLWLEEGIWILYRGLEILCYLASTDLSLFWPTCLLCRSRQGLSAFPTKSLCLCCSLCLKRLSFTLPLLSHCWALLVNGISSERSSLITLSKVSSSTTKGINSLLCHPCWKSAQMSNCTSRLSLWTFSGRLLIFMFSDFMM